MTKLKYNSEVRVMVWVAMVLIISSFSSRERMHPASPASIRIVFVNKIGGKDLVLQDSTYINPSGESYRVTKFRYYVTDIFLGTTSHNHQRIPDSRYLIDASKPSSQIIQVQVPAGTYHSLGFLLGVDSLLNVSGAQTGALDPANDMFWTWNSGYVMAKMEGNSPASTRVNQKFEYHIGGFSGPNKVLQLIELPFGGTLEFSAGKTYTIYVDAEINSWWKSVHAFSISTDPVITTPGKLAREMSENYAHMFQIEKIITGSH